MYKYNQVFPDPDGMTVSNLIVLLRRRGDAVNPYKLVVKHCGERLTKYETLRGVKNVHFDSDLAQLRILYEGRQLTEADEREKELETSVKAAIGWMRDHYDGTPEASVVLGSLEAALNC